MSYVPPNKRRGRQQITTAATTAVTSERKAASDHHRFDDTNNNNNADEEFFCNVFSAVRCINLARRPEQWDRFCLESRRIGSEFFRKVVRFDAVDGQKAVDEEAREKDDDDGSSSQQNSEERAAARIGRDVAWEWDTTQNSLWDRHVAPGMIRQLTPGEIGCALSHVSLWKELATTTEINKECNNNAAAGLTESSLPLQENCSLLPFSMLILEDDAAFLKPRKRHQNRRTTGFSKRTGGGRPQKMPSSVKKDDAPTSDGNRFLRAFRAAYDLVPDDWDVLYLGFSDRGERREPITGRASGGAVGGGDDDDIVVRVFRPTYGFHTHAYAVRSSAADRFLRHLPVVGPVDVWLADNRWFGLNVYCAIVANEGWKNTGAPLVGQDRRHVATGSSVGMSGR